MADLTKLKKSRATSRSWLQREVTKLQAILEVKEPDVSELSLAIAEFDGRLVKWDAAQEAVEVELDEEQIDADISAAGDFRDKCLAMKAKAMKLMNSMNSNVTVSDDGGTTHSGSKSVFFLGCLRLICLHSLETCLNGPNSGNRSRPVSIPRRSLRFQR